MKNKKTLFIALGVLFGGAVLGAFVWSQGTYLKGDLSAVPYTNMTFSLSDQVKSSTYVGGQINVPLLAFTMSTQNSAQEKVTKLVFRGYLDCDENGTFTSIDTAAAGTYENLCPTTENPSHFSTTVKNLALYFGDQKVSNVAQVNVDQNNFDWVVFDNLNATTFTFYSTMNKTFTLRGDISSTSPVGNLSDRIKFGIEKEKDVTVVDAKNMPVPDNTINFYQLPPGSANVTNAAASDVGVRMTIKKQSTTPLGTTPPTTPPPTSNPPPAVPNPTPNPNLPPNPPITNPNPFGTTPPSNPPPATTNPNPNPLVPSTEPKTPPPAPPSPNPFSVKPR